MGTLRDVLDAAAAGRFQPADGTTTVLPQPTPRDAGVLSFTAHTVVFTDEDADWVYQTLRSVDSDPLAASMSPRFLTALLDRTGRTAETIDAVPVADPLPGEPSCALREIEDPAQPRIAYARHRRDGVRAWATDGGALALGRGVAGRPRRLAVRLGSGGLDAGRPVAATGRRRAFRTMWSCRGAAGPRPSGRTACPPGSGRGR
ncbi:GNAT family N-acetyltransferase [Streptomyces rubradiris]|uniref:N-acetyltransferase n=1 Tax=Streptomyces rubradiris TaxID=285531 RepID=A0ABQ3RHC2_STRRR|nr:N-acetyltransferase [Streptomyces rubradiris]GHI55215.1 N-acetyltransferase [Streptomyces rubradiris]